MSLGSNPMRMPALRRGASWMRVAALELLLTGLGLVIGVAIVSLLVSST